MVCRKRPIDAASEYDAAVSNIFQVLMNVSRDFLNRSGSGAGDIGDNEVDFLECICESLVSLGSLNLQCIITDGTVLHFYLQQVDKPFIFYYSLMSTD